MLIALTLLNLGMLGVTIFQDRVLAAPAAASDAILRGRGLEIVDDRGRVRASIAIHPAANQPDGSIYPEIVLLRLITSQGRPVVKISSSEDGAAMALSAPDGPGYVQVLARGSDPAVVIADRSGHQTSTLP